MKVQDVFTFVGEPEDLRFLNTPFLDVNMRLYNSSASYHKIIATICSELEFLALSHLEGYGRPFGISGANIGVPLNIIGVVRNREVPGLTDCRIMINPHIQGWSKTHHVSKSNCGSIRLAKSLPVRRFDWVEVTWFDENGIKWTKPFSQALGGDTVQHEVDHNQGILITDREATSGVS